jgi:hypothetical protein
MMAALTADELKAVRAGIDALSHAVDAAGLGQPGAA